MVNFKLLAGKLLRSMRVDGVAGTYRRVAAQFKRASADEFDRHHGTDTGGIEPLWKLRIESPNARYGERYEATTAEELESAIAFLDNDPREFAFIDLGCGKGRTLMVASRLGFAQAIGVEFAEELARTAHINLQTLRSANVMVRHDDAANFKFPDRDLVLFLYNPFSEQVLGRVLQHLAAVQHRRIYVVYKHPRCSALLDATGFLQRMDPPRGAGHIAFWRTVGVSPGEVGA